MSKLKIGITGGIGSGKSFCARFFTYMGIPFYNADQRAQYLMIHDPTVKNDLVQLLGENVYLQNGRINKPFMRDQIFKNPVIREAVNEIVHPAVGRDYEKWHQESVAPFTMKEAALLVESGSYKDLDHLIMVEAPLQLRMQRVIRRDNISSEEVRHRIDSQWPDEEKSKVADSVIDNSGLFPLLPQIISHYNQLVNR